MSPDLALRCSATLGFLAVALGAFGAHGLQDLLERSQRVDTWETAASYHLIHAVVLVWLSAREPFLKGAWWCFFIGTLIFSGSLYALCLTQISALGAITPLGGLGMLAGWALLAFQGRSSN
jgi:uncharacterized membrane protein YgdD (TMEM256/DUF423 family)